MSDNIVQFPPRKNQDYLSPGYAYNVSVKIEGVDLGHLPEDIWQYGVHDAVKDIRKNRLRQELDDLYNVLKDRPESWDLVIASVNRLKSQY